MKSYLKKCVCYLRAENTLGYKTNPVAVFVHKIKKKKYMEMIGIPKTPKPLHSVNNRNKFKKK